MALKSTWTLAISAVDTFPPPPPPPWQLLGLGLPSSSPSKHDWPLPSACPWDSL